jgi:hypothetical protein
MGLCVDWISVDSALGGEPEVTLGLPSGNEKIARRERPLA